jgi:ribosomal protein L31E
MNKKEITVKIDVKVKNSKRKATFAIRELKRQIKKHFRTEDFLLDNELNNFFWKEGKKQAPSKVSVVGVKEKNKLLVFLADSKSLKDYEAKKKAEKEKKAKKAKQEKEKKEKKEEKPKKEDEKK